MLERNVYDERPELVATYRATTVTLDALVRELDDARAWLDEGSARLDSARKHTML